MIQIAILISALISVFTGITVVALGEWKRFALKFAAVSLCLMVDLSLMSVLFFHPDELANPIHAGIVDMVSVLLIAKNIDHILFYIAFGRDAIIFRKKDRRGFIQSYRRAA